MSHWFAKRGTTLIPADESAVRSLRRLTDGEAVQVNVLRSRNPRWHRLFMGGCAAIADNCDPPLTTEAVKEAIKLYAGHVVIVKDKKGAELMIPARIAFDKLDADEWDALWPSLEKAAIEHFGFDFQLFANGLAGFYE